MGLSAALACKIPDTRGGGVIRKPGCTRPEPCVFHTHTYGPCRILIGRVSPRPSVSEIPQPPRQHEHEVETDLQDKRRACELLRVKVNDVAQQGHARPQHAVRGEVNSPDLRRQPDHAVLGRGLRAREAAAHDAWVDVARAVRRGGGPWWLGGGDVGIDESGLARAARVWPVAIVNVAAARAPHFRGGAWGGCRSRCVPARSHANTSIEAWLTSAGRCARK
mmetsp:Transcript_89784/g.256625  ORF Transcript_89784/g.256625 Transcript_89784/m.256625 type:complete len:221 (-) Transcript_89784:371-1033(-)